MKRGKGGSERGIRREEGRQVRDRQGGKVFQEKREKTLSRERRIRTDQVRPGVFANVPKKKNQRGPLTGKERKSFKKKGGNHSRGGKKPLPNEKKKTT